MIRTAICSALAICACLGQTMQSACNATSRMTVHAASTVPTRSAQRDISFAELTDERVALALQSANIPPRFWPRAGGPAAQPAEHRAN